MAGSSGLRDSFCAMANKRYEYKAIRSGNGFYEIEECLVGEQVALDDWRLHSVVPEPADDLVTLIFEREVTSPA